jgi:alanyl-tRNA synthetase
LTGNEIRETFLGFFEEKGHRRVRSSSLVPTNDPTLLFTNAGMNQFKDVFLGVEQRDYKRATTCQKCVRAGGKHNDLENVGFTNRHHTFFEMLGNFSFGDYFKKDAIAFAWELVTSSQWFGIPKDKLYVTIFKGEEGIARDGEAHNQWVNQGVEKSRIHELGIAENFWAMGDTGPCGPCSEIHYDMGPAASDQGHSDCQFPCDCGRYVEIWNLVFMQFNRDASGTLNPLPKPSVDTGLGLERLAAVLQGKISNFDTDIFSGLIVAARGLIGAHGGSLASAESAASTASVPLGASAETAASLRIIADHARATTFLISDGVVPSNEGRGYVLRKIMRRAIRHARFLGGNFYVLSNMARSVSDEMRDPYPELVQNLPRIQQVIRAEEERFSKTIEFGLEKLAPDLEQLVRERNRQVHGFDKIREELKSRETSKVSALVNDYHVPFEWVMREASAAGVQLASNPERFEPVLVPSYPGEKAFKLYDTYGLPRDFIEDVARDAGVLVDWDGFDRAMEEQRTRARASWKGVHKEAASPAYAKLAETSKTEPDFYFGTETRDCRIEAIVTKDGLVNELPAGAEGEVVLDRTTIYAESGGQVADTGLFLDNRETQQLAEVRGAYYPVSRLVAHRVVAKETLHVGDRVATVADPIRRARDRRNHTATHLLHSALRNILGTHVKQAGSLVAPDHLRFDFAHFAAVDPSDLAEIEQQVNEEIRRNYEVQTDLMNIDAALASGALAFFGDKYPDANVRVVTIPDAEYPRGFYSKELCGGTHVTRSGDIGVFKIRSEQSAAAGVRRIEAISGERALAEYQHALATLGKIAGLVKSSPDEVLAAVERQALAVKQLEKELEGQRRKTAVSMVDTLLESARKVKDVNVLASTVSGVDRDGMRQLVDSLRQKLGSGVVILGAADDGKVALITGVTKDLTSRVQAGKIVQELARKVGGSGGGRPDIAEAGGKDTSALESAISDAYSLLERML